MCNKKLVNSTDELPKQVFDAMVELDEGQSTNLFSNPNSKLHGLTSEQILAFKKLGTDHSVNEALTLL
jgi:hypothetical protein